jgi:L-lactate utilization protein LutB
MGRADGAAHGLWEHIRLWTCLRCNQCSHACPMQVEPASLVARLRDEAVRQGVVSAARREAVESLLAELHRARWHMVDRCAAGGEIETGDPYARWSVKGRFGIHIGLRSLCAPVAGYRALAGWPA